MPRSEDKRIKVLVAQPDSNPYQLSLYAELEKFGIKSDIKLIKLSDYLRNDNKFYNIYHLHWLHRFYRSKYQFYAFFKAILFIYFLRMARKHGIKIFVTAHNILPHEMKFRKIEWYVQKQIKTKIDAMIFHDMNAKKEYSKLFGDSQIKSFIINHGVYEESQVPLPDKFEARKYFGIKSNETCILYLGKASKRKGYDLAINTALEIASPKTHFIFAGLDCNKDDFSKILNCTVIDHYIPHHELAALFAATDYVILPYRNCTTSGLANLSIGFGKPFLCSDTPYLKDLCQKGFGIVYDIDDPMDFKLKLSKASESINIDRYTKNREAYLEENSWENCARKTYDAYVQVIKNNSLTY
jgi:glycosyltransferase involved in cell wall biosynthesis